MKYKIIIKTLFAVTLVIAAARLCAQQYSLAMLSSSVPTNLRGLCPVTDSTVWVCGNNGHIGRSTNGGQNWQWIIPKGYETSDFRDIEAFDAERAIVMASGTPAVILETSNGGHTWHEVYRSDDTVVFLDALDFWDENNGLCLGDWINGKPFLLMTTDGGKKWIVQAANGKKIGEKTASFAASGTCLRVYEEKKYRAFAAAIATDGKHGLLTCRYNTDNNTFDYEFYEAPYVAATQTEGIFSLCLDAKQGTVWMVGGDYANRTNGYNVVVLKDRFLTPQSRVGGYRSCIELFEQNGTQMLIACGLNGADVTETAEIKWENISGIPLNTAIKAKYGVTVFLCGPQGTIYKLENEK